MCVTSRFFAGALCALLRYYMPPVPAFMLLCGMIGGLYHFSGGSVKALWVLTWHRLHPLCHRRWPAVFAVIVAVGLVAGVICGLHGNHSLFIHGQRLDTAVNGPEDVVRIAGFFSVSVDPDHVSSEQVLIPKNFHGIFQQYDQLQKNIGPGLSDFRGRRVLKYSAPVLDSPQNDKTILTILVCDRHFIGGDISSCEFGGEMRSLDGKLFSP